MKKLFDITDKAQERLDFIRDFYNDKYGTNLSEKAALEFAIADSYNYVLSECIKKDMLK